ncbi:conserved hypothetical protein [Paecilomyces variotii No. 5]|uniref:PhoD-like phosphatase domain-containing protein n=1 Tax=Byssochlamys spectabilis (strain No. 5 / NBRC 109023) TaxID=1356009 RepID=V5GGJ6_BYSSN|nr:conserved hypothetical protein [Paecilomyces variotii No. 5]
MATTTSRPPPGFANGDSVPYQEAAATSMARASSTRQRPSAGANGFPVGYEERRGYVPVTSAAPGYPSIPYRNGSGAGYRRDGQRSFSARTREMPPQWGSEGPQAVPQNPDMAQGQKLANNARIEPARRAHVRHVSTSGPSVSIPTEPTNQAQSSPKLSDTASTRQGSQETPLSRSSTTRSAKGQKRDWAPDRSPLQRLEVKLNDISKEEKRARVLEAELRLKERLARQEKEKQAASDQNNAPSPERVRSRQGSTATPVAAGEAPSAIGSSSQHKRTPSYARSMSTWELDSPTESMTGYTELQYSARPSTVSRSGVSSNVRHVEVQRPRQPQYSLDQGRGLETASNDQKSPLPYSGQEYSSGNERFSWQPDTHHHIVSDNSYFPAGNARTPQRSESKRLQKVPPENYYHRATNDEHQYERPTMDRGSAEADPAPMEHMLTEETDNQQYQQQEEELLQHHDSSTEEVVKPKQKKQTVQFDMPPPTPPPLSEWKQAPVARLSAADMEFQTFDADKGKAWWERGPNTNRRKSRALPSDYQKPVPKANENNRFDPILFLKCGPLLRYTGMRRDKIDGPEGQIDLETWRGSVMIVTKDSLSSYEPAPTLRLFSQPMDLLPPPPVEINSEDGIKLAPEYVDPTAGLTKVGRDGRVLYVKPVEHIEEGVDLSTVESEDGLFEETRSPIDYDGQSPPVPSNRIHPVDGETTGRYREISGIRLYADSARDVTFWRFSIEVELGDKQQRIAYRINQGPAIGFWVPARGQSMNIMFHTCNGFSLSVDPNKFSGPDPLWRDVLNEHQTRPFHVMIGGGDQIYNDKVMVETEHFQEWIHIKNPHDKRHAPFSPEMKAELETFFLERYCMWFSQGLFGLANCQIPMINIWDDHDIIDGFGSYPDHFMRTPVFSGLGNVAFKYYMLFQHQSVPEETEADEPSWILGAEPGPYIKERSRSVFMFLGKGTAFLGLDCRTERMRGDILSEQTYDLIWDRCHREIVKGDTKHLIVLLGVPIAYPRLVWLENILTSRIMDPVKALGRAGMLGHLVNKFDGSVEILDDLDDHWTAKHHKLERTWLVEDLQDLAAEKSVRVTILSGDVHLGAMGQFYSNPRLNLAKDKDYRYMPNVISSAIVNTPPPDMLADVLNKRNKIHHMDSNTDESMIPIFTHDVDDKPRNNKRLLPRRNWCSIREYQPGFTPPATPEPATPPTPPSPPGKLKRTLSLTRGTSGPSGLMRRLSSRGSRPPTKEFNLGKSGGRSASMDIPQRPFETGDGYFPQDQEPRPNHFHRRPTNLSEKARKEAIEAEDGAGGYVNLEGGLDVTLHVEVSPMDPAGITRPYKLLVPALWYEGGYDPRPTRVAKGWKKWLGIGKKKETRYLDQGASSDMEDGYDGYSGSEDDRPPSPGALPMRTGRAHSMDVSGDATEEEDDYSDGDVEEVNQPKRKKWFNRVSR